MSPAELRTLNDEIATLEEELAALVKKRSEGIDEARDAVFDQAVQDGVAVRSVDDDGNVCHEDTPGYDGELWRRLKAAGLLIRG